MTNTSDNINIDWYDPNQDEDNLDLIKNPEDLSIFVQLIVGQPYFEGTNRSKDITLEWVCKQNDRKSVLGGDNEYHTLTDFSDKISFLESSTATGGNSEGLGIKSINITYNSMYIPEVNIEFIDVRGISLMNPSQLYQINKKDQDIKTSFFSAFYSFPYPQFTLVIKGVYGQPVLYTLHVLENTTTIDPDTGNVLLSTKFLGYSFSMFADINWTWLKMAPDMEYLQGVEHKIWEDKISKYGLNDRMGNKICDIPSMSKFYEKILSTISNLQHAINDSTLAQNEINLTKLLVNLNEIDRNITNIFGLLSNGDYDRSIINVIYSDDNWFISLSSANEFNTGGTNYPTLYTTLHKIFFGATVKGGQETYIQLLEELERNINAYNNNPITEANFPAIFKRSIRSAINYATASVNQTNETSIPLDDIFERTNPEGEIETLTFTIKNTKDFIIQQRQKITQDLKANKEALMTFVLSQTESNSGLGFPPTIGNILRIFFAHYEMFFTLFLDVQKDKTRKVADWFSFPNPPQNKTLMPWFGIKNNDTKNWEWAGSSYAENICHKNVDDLKEVKFVKSFSKAIRDFRRFLSETGGGFSNLSNEHIWNPINPFDISNAFFELTDTSIFEESTGYKPMHTINPYKEVLNEIKSEGYSIWFSNFSLSIGIRMLFGLSSDSSDFTETESYAKADSENFYNAIKDETGFIKQIMERSDPVQYFNDGVLHLFNNQLWANKGFTEDNDTVISFFNHSNPSYKFFNKNKYSLIPLNSNSQNSLLPLAIKSTNEYCNVSFVKDSSYNNVIAGEALEIPFWEIGQSYDTLEEDKITSLIRIFNWDDSYSNIPSHFVNSPVQLNYNLDSGLFQNIFKDSICLIDDNTKIKSRSITNYGFRGLNGNSLNTTTQIYNAVEVDDAKMDDYFENWYSINNARSGNSNFGLYIKYFPAGKSWVPRTMPNFLLDLIGAICDTKEIEKCFEDVMFKRPGLYRMPLIMILYIGARFEYNSNSFPDFFRAVGSFFCNILKEWKKTNLSQLEELAAIKIITNIDFFNTFKKKVHDSAQKGDPIPDISDIIGNVNYMAYSITNYLHDYSTTINLIIKPESDLARSLINLITTDVLLMTSRYECFWAKTDAETIKILSSEIDQGVVEQYVRTFSENLINKLKGESNDVEPDDPNSLSKYNDHILHNYYYSFKNFHDKWLYNVNVNEEKFTLLHYLGGKNGICQIIDKYYYDIRDKLICNLEVIKTLIENIDNGNDSFLTVLSNLFSAHKMLFIPTPNNLTNWKRDGLREVFKPVPYIDVNWADVKESPSFVGIYVGEPAKEPFTDTNILDDDTNQVTMSIMNEAEATSKAMYMKNIYGVGTYHGNQLPLFAVNYGKQNNQYFKVSSMSNTSGIATDQGIKTEVALANRGNDYSSGEVPQGQDLFDIYSAMAYTSTVSMMGCPQIMPMMYYQLNNVWLFTGCYMIFKIEHKITPGTMTTTFTGIKQTFDRPKLLDEPFSLNVIMSNPQNNGSSITNSYPLVGNPATYNDSYKLSEHLTWGMYCQTIRNNNNNTLPPEEYMDNIRYVATNLWDPLFKAFDGKIEISSSYRSPQYNHDNGGAPQSLHTRGEALDIKIKGSTYKNSDIYHYVRKNLKGKYTELIWEQGDPRKNEEPRWVHIGYRQSEKDRPICIAIKDKKNIKPINTDCTW